MHINFLMNPVYDGWSPKDNRLGGTEESVVKWAEGLYSLGHSVRVYMNGFTGSYKQVVYRDRNEYNGGGDVCVNIKSGDIAPKEPTAYLTNETDANELDLSAYDCVIFPSTWAKYNIPVNNNNVYILPHGYDPETIYPGNKIPKQCFYASSPDRGLSNLIEAWGEVHKAHPDATLIVTYGGLLHMDGVMNLGEVSEEEMNDIYRTSDIWCHPCNGGELYCMTGKKAQVSGCIPVIIPEMALQETVERGYKVDNPKDYAKTLIEVLDLTPEFRDMIRQDVIKHANAFTWEESTNKLEKLLLKVYNKSK